MTTYLYLPGKSIYHIQSKTGTPLCAQRARRSFHFSPILPPNRRLCPRCQKTKAILDELRLKVLSVRLTEAEYQKIEELAKGKGISRMRVITEAIRAYVGLD